MNYQLAKDLKTAGFPQTMHWGRRGYALPNHPVGVKEGKLQICTKGDDHIEETIVRAPSSGEILEECLKLAGAFYIAVSPRGISIDRGGQIDEPMGQKIDEVLAHFYITLKKGL